MDNEHDHKTKAFKSLLDGLKQHVHGHVLDLVITDQAYPNLLLVNGPLIEGYVDSDHIPLRFHISWMKPAKPSKSIKYRRWKTLNKEAFKADLRAACLTYDLACNTNALVKFYDSTLNAILEKHLPFKQNVVTEHANCPSIIISFVLVKLSKGDLNGVGAELRRKMINKIMSTNVRKLMIYC